MQKMIIELEVDDCCETGTINVSFSPDVPVLLPHEFHKYSEAQAICVELLESLKNKLKQVFGDD